MRSLRDANLSLGESLKAALQRIELLRRSEPLQDGIDDEFKFMPERDNDDEFQWDYSYFKWQNFPRDVRRQMVLDRS